MQMKKVRAREVSDVQSNAHESSDLRDIMLTTSKPHESLGVYIQRDAHGSGCPQMGLISIPRKVTALCRSIFLCI